MSDSVYCNGGNFVEYLHANKNSKQKAYKYLDKGYLVEYLCISFIAFDFSSGVQDLEPWWPVIYKDELTNGMRRKLSREWNQNRSRAKYVRPSLELFNNSSDTHHAQVPVIDLHGLTVPHLKKKTVAEISSAAEKWGFFQIVNHGIPESLLLVYKPDMSKWPKQPSDFTYCSLYCVVYMHALCGGLGLVNENAIVEALGGEQKEIYLGINYYPPCPHPERVLGVSPHSDVDAVTILLHNQTSGLQIRKDDAWLDVPCIPGALVVNIGDQIEILSNGKYKIIEHRGFVHKNRTRMSWAMHCTPPPCDVLISPLKELINEENPPLYAASSF
ncbi:anthocyanin synthase-like [Cryptomeria japonica]|uniref:anthocyanin synthase-like n=1 Tax=Cryptomeria japonica TaxID=3369 RepID=UPI0027DA4DBC|nr:anthocyanin synthase-like [Cryptomeria japonica]